MRVKIKLRSTSISPANAGDMIWILCRQQNFLVIWGDRRRWGTPNTFGDGFHFGSSLVRLTAQIQGFLLDANFKRVWLYTQSANKKRRTYSVMKHVRRLAWGFEDIWKDFRVFRMDVSLVGTSLHIIHWLFWAQMNPWRVILPSRPLFHFPRAILSLLLHWQERGSWR